MTYTKTKPLTVRTSESMPDYATHEQDWYEYDGYCGPMYSRDYHNGDSDGCRKITVIAADMFSGSHEEWDSHIISCIRDAIAEGG